jgi:hypothetical protein
MELFKTILNPAIAQARVDRADEEKEVGYFWDPRGAAFTSGLTRSVSAAIASPNLTLLIRWSSTCGVVDASNYSVLVVFAMFFSMRCILQATCIGDRAAHDWPAWSV